MLSFFRTEKTKRPDPAAAAQKATARYYELKSSNAPREQTNAAYQLMVQAEAALRKNAGKR